ncbi:MAG: iron ABC transporter permease, partial [Alphaproteobacteria bacterium]
METISDFGTVEYFAIETLTLGIFNVWFGMNNLAAAAQIATVAFLFIIALLAMEIIARARRRFTDTSRRAISLPPIKRTGWGAFGCFATCSLPIIAGFVIPVGVLLNFALRDQSHELTDGILLAARNTLLLALSVAVLVMMSAAFLGIASAYQG